MLGAWRHVAVPIPVYFSLLLQSKVSHWAHTAMLTFHPGVTVFIIKQRFWRAKNPNPVLYLPSTGPYLYIILVSKFILYFDL